MTIDPERYKNVRGVDDERDDDDDERDDVRGALSGDDEMELDQLLDSYAESDGYVFLRRHEQGDWVFLAKLDIPDAKLDQIQSRFGGGKFRVEIMNEGGRRLRQRTFRIAGKPKTDDDANTSAPTDIETRMARIEQLLLDKEQKPANGDSLGVTEVLRVALTALTQKPQVDPLMSTLITALVSGKKTADGVDPLELQKLLQAAEDRGYNRGKELGEAIAGAGGEGDGVARALAANLPGVIDAFRSAKQSYDRIAPRPVQPKPAAQFAAPGIVNEPGPEPKPLPTTAPTTEGEAMGLGWINALRPAVPVILKWARDGKDPVVKAQNTIDDLRDDIREAIAAQAEEPDFVSSVITAIPEFQAPDVQAWVTTFLTTVQETLTDTDEPTEPAEA